MTRLYVRYTEEVQRSAWIELDPAVARLRSLNLPGAADAVAAGPSLAGEHGTSTQNRAGRPMAQLAYRIAEDPEAFGIEPGGRVVTVLVAFPPADPADAAHWSSPDVEWRPS